MCLFHCDMLYALYIEVRVYESVKVSGSTLPEVSVHATGSDVRCEVMSHQRNLLPENLAHAETSKPPFGPATVDTFKISLKSLPFVYCKFVGT